jgi:predicted GNAT family acetyltransferase
MNNNEVSNNEARHRYELSEAGETAFAVYQVEGNRVLFTHTVVPEALEGKGVGSRLVAAALDDVRARRLKAVPLCAFVEHYFDKHPEVRDLLP